MNIANAYWISSYGTIYDVKTNHIDFITDNLNKFNISKKEIEAIYKKYNEPNGLEGKARNEILTNQLKNGWIRIRKQRNSWIIQIFDITNTTKINIYNFIVDCVMNKIIGPHDDVSILDLSKENKKYNYTASEIIIGKEDTLFENINTRLHQIIIENTKRITNELYKYLI